MPRPKKNQRYQLQTYKNPGGTESYRVTGTSPDGKRIRKNFSERTQAVREMADLEEEASRLGSGQRLQRTRLSPEELADAEAASESAGSRRLAPIITHYLSLEVRAKACGITLDTAMRFTEGHYRDEVQEATILNASEEFLDSRTSSQRTSRNYKAGMKLLLKPDPNRLVNNFGVADIDARLRDYSNTNTKKTYLRIFSVFFNWAKRHHYCLENPCDRVDKIPKDNRQIAILSFDEIQRLLYAAMQYQDGAAVAPVAIGLFAGLRPSEIAELKASDVTPNKIHVSGGKMKRTFKRVVPISANLAKWLKKYPFNGLPNGWDSKHKVLRAATNATRWAQDVIRHTSVSYQTERDQDEGLTAFNCGTSKQMMDRHYRNSVANEELLAAFWDLTPEAVKNAAPEIELPVKLKPDWPAKNELKKLVWKKPLIHAAKEIGVSDVALKRRCVKLGIALPAQGHWLRQRPH